MLSFIHSHDSLALRCARLWWWKTREYLRSGLQDLWVFGIDKNRNNYPLCGLMRALSDLFCLVCFGVGGCFSLCFSLFVFPESYSSFIYVYEFLKGLSEDFMKTLYRLWIINSKGYIYSTMDSNTLQFLLTKELMITLSLVAQGK